MKEAQTRTPVELQQFLRDHAIKAELLPDIGHTPTVPAAAQALGVDAEQIVKTLLFLVEHPESEAPVPVVVISHGERRIDKAKVAERFGVGKKRVGLAPAAVVVEELGYPAGGVPPFGHRTAFPVIVDASVVALTSHNEHVIYAGGGDDRTMMRLTVEGLLRVTAAEVLAVS